MRDPETIAAKLREGDRLAVARAISWAENADARFADVLEGVFDLTDRGWRTGVTGPPGAGKSTLVNQLAQALRRRDDTVGILAVDPSSPFTGGALLGDRIRMEERTKDAGVYIRSMASRDSHGGLARATVDACDVMDAAGLQEILVETVGVGQAEYDVMDAVDTVVVVLCPGAGDDIQAMKAGLLEVADVLVVNKADRDGADRLVLDLEEAVHTRAAREGGWTVPVVPTVAARGEGIDALVEALTAHRGFLADRLAEVRRGRRLRQVRRVVEERLQDRLWGDGGLTERVESALSGDATPYDVAEDVLAAILRGDLASALEPVTSTAGPGSAGSNPRPPSEGNR